MDLRFQRQQSPRDLAVKFTETLTPSGMLPEPPKTRAGKSLALYSRSRKAVALARIEYLPIQQAGRSLLALLVQLARGARARSWMKDETIAELLPRSGGGSYSVYHVRRWRRLLEDVGLVRSSYVKPGEAFPSGEAPDVDGGGYETGTGGNVVEVNMEALLGVAPVWRGPVRSLGWKDELEAREAVAELGAELEAAPEAAPELVEDPPPPAEGVITHAHPRVIIHAHPSRDLGSPPENHPDPVRQGAPRESSASGARVASETPSASEAPSAIAPRPRSAPESETGEHEGKKEQTARQEAPRVTAEQMRFGLEWLERRWSNGLRRPLQ